MSGRREHGQNGSSETTPLLLSTADDSTAVNPLQEDPRKPLFDFLQATTAHGKLYERFIILLIGLNVVAFVASTLFLEEYNSANWADPNTGICGKRCDALWFGNYKTNGLDDLLHIGATSILEIFTVLVFSVEYVLRLYTADLESVKYQGLLGRIRYIPTFFSLVDLASTLPFYIDSFILRETDWASSSFLRMFRLLRMIRAEGRYDTALTMVDDVYHQQKAVLGTALFVGMTTWVTVSALYYLTERRNLDLLYCAACDTDNSTDIDTSLCTLDAWGMADCTLAGCPGTDEIPHPCYNLYESIPMASYYALLNLFGEFPLADQHSAGGQIVGTVTAVIAVAVFALPVGIIGNGFEQVIEQRRQRQPSQAAPIVESSGMTRGYRPSDPTTTPARWYNLLHATQDSNGSLPGLGSTVDVGINVLIGLSAASFMVGTLVNLSAPWRLFLSFIDLLVVLVFTVEYVLRVYSVTEDPKYRHNRWAYVTSFLAIVHLLSFAPFWVEVMFTGTLVSAAATTSTWSFLVQTLRLLRILRFERYTHAFMSFDDVLRRNQDVLAITAFTAVLCWIFFSAFLYLSERDSHDDEMATNYRTMPDSMWMTLLNLTGESPLCQYSAAGKFVTGILGLFATGVFGIPIGVLGAGFEEVIEEENEDNTEELQRETNDAVEDEEEDELGTPIERAAYKFAAGIGSQAAAYFEVSVYLVIFLAVGVGAWQTVAGHENDFAQVEVFAVVFFTVEYAIRFVGVGADPEFAKGRNSITSRLFYIGSFYSIIDLLAIVPFYLALALPNSFIDEYGDLLRMLRTVRLVKLDNRIPSITLIDDVIRLKFNALRVAFYAAVTLWVIFSSLLFLCEYTDDVNDLDDPVPLYGCSEDCTMMDRFQNYFDSMIYTAIHLTGDYPITTYTWPARFVNFFMVIAAVGVVSIPSGLIANGFVEIVQSKKKVTHGEAIPTGGMAGDDWYDIRFRELEGVDPPASRFGPQVDAWQHAVHDFLNGTRNQDGHHTYSTPAFIGRIFIFAVIIANVIAVLAESVPTIDKTIGNQPGNFFDQFEVFSVMIFATEYILRLFCAPKNRESLYSSWIYATTFFGIVDLLSTAPWFVQQGLMATGKLGANSDSARVFRCFRIFRLLQLEDFLTAFSKLDNVLRASRDVLKATGLLALIIWVGCGGLFYIFEENNPNWRECDDSIPPLAETMNDPPGCFDFTSTAACNVYYPGLCSQKAFTDIPNSLYYTAVFLGGEWAIVDFTWPGRLVCLFLCVVGIGLYAIPVGTLFDSFGAVLGLAEDEGEDEDD